MTDKHLSNAFLHLVEASEDLELAADTDDGITVEKARRWCDIDSVRQVQSRVRDDLRRRGVIVVLPEYRPKP